MAEARRHIGSLVTLFLLANPLFFLFLFIGQLTLALFERMIWTRGHENSLVCDLLSILAVATGAHCAASRAFEATCSHIATHCLSEIASNFDDSSA